MGIIGCTASPTSTVPPSAHERKNSGHRSYRSLCSTAAAGGEKARVALACFVLTPQNVLILDEPSNHLDVDTVAALAGGLNAFEGAIVVISHDRAFVEELRPTHVLTVTDGAATLEKRELVDADWDVSSIDERGAIIEEAAA